MTDESSQPKVKSFVHRIPNPVGRPYKIKSSQELWDKFVAYCDDVENDPWQQKTGSNSIAGGSMTMLHHILALIIDLVVAGKMSMSAEEFVSSLKLLQQRE